MSTILYHLGEAGEILAHIPWNRSLLAKEISESMGGRFNPRQVSQIISQRLLHKYVRRGRRSKLNQWKYWRIR